MAGIFWGRGVRVKDIFTLGEGGCSAEHLANPAVKRLKYWLVTYSFMWVSPKAIYKALEYAVNMGKMM